VTLGWPVWSFALTGLLAPVLGGAAPPLLIHEIGSQLIVNSLAVTAIVLLVAYWEKLPATSMGWKRPSAKDLLWMFPFWLATMTILAVVGAPSEQSAPLESVLALPLWFKFVFLPVVAGTEEVIFRGYPAERLIGLTGRRWIAGLVTWSVFVAAHMPFIGFVDTLFYTAPGALILTVFYLWRRNLPANVLLHFLINLPVFLPASVVGVQ
jgi:uncharacterized protein